MKKKLLSVEYMVSITVEDHENLFKGFHSIRVNGSINDYIEKKVRNFYGCNDGSITIAVNSDNIKMVITGLDIDKANALSDTMIIYFLTMTILGGKLNELV
jgi:hypothetical protein